MLRTLTLCLFTAFATQTSAQSLAGKWDCEGHQGRNIALRTLQEYRPSGRFFHLANIAMVEDGDRLDISISLRGKWTLEGDIIVETLSRAKVRSIVGDGEDLTNTEFGRFLKKEMPFLLFGPLGISRSKVTFTSADQFKMAGGETTGVCNKR